MSPWAYVRPYKLLIALGVAMLVATNVLFLGIPVMLGEIIDALKGDDPAAKIQRLAIWMIVFALATAITRIVSRVALFNAARKAEYELRSDLFAHLLRFEPAFYRQNPTGDLMSRLTNDVQTVRVLWGAGILNVINTVCAFGAVLVMMVRIDPMLTFWAMLPYPSMVLLGRIFGRRIYRASRGVQEQLGKLSSSVQEDLTGIGVVKTYTLEPHRRAGFRGLSEVLLERNMRLTVIRGQLGPVLTALGSLGTVVVLWIGGKMVIGDEMTLGDLIEFNTYLARLVWPTLALGWMLSLYQRGLASWARLDQLLAAEPTIADDPAAAPPTQPLRGHLQVRGLTITTAEGRPILDDIHLEVPAGTVCAIVGRTGAGKSTLIEAMPRLLDVPAGTVFIDGYDITKLPLATLRRAIGYAPQEAFLFSTTIAGNIAFGYERHGEQAGAAGLQRAATAAGLAKDLASLPAGFDTVVGERGITLSGGQRQRVALARALAAAPPLLILDDSLSSVDAETEREILVHLTEILEHRTALLISHRVAAVKRADQIVVLDGGRIVERGTHQELLARGGVYSEVYQSQLDEALSEGAAGEPR